MAPQDDLTAERAAKLYSLLHATISHDGIFGPDDIKAIRKMEIVDKALIIAALQAARQEALREAASKLGIGDSSGLLDAPCLWCGYNGRGYYQVGTHDKSCIWHTVGGRNERLDRLASEGG